MKYIIVLGDGMADFPIKELGNRTPLQAAYKPYMDSIAASGELGLVKTVPEGLPPGSDVANLSVMGYDPLKYYTGRSPLEAVSMGVEMLPTDVAIRCNLVTLKNPGSFEDSTMLDYSSDEISTEEAGVLIKYLQDNLANDDYNFFAGISYRHCVIWSNGQTELNLTPPHDILEKKIFEYLPKGDKNKDILELMKKSHKILSNHPLNLERVKKGLNPANCIWLWGEGRKPQLDSFEERYNIKGAVISAVDLIKGIGRCADMTIYNVEGATGNIHTNFKGKMEATIQALKEGHDFVYLHIEAPDECGHRNEMDNKVKSIEIIDKQVVGPLIEASKELGPINIMILPDHPTPLSLRTHTSEPVPFALARIADGKPLDKKPVDSCSYDEASAKSTGLKEEHGHNLVNRLLDFS